MPVSWSLVTHINKKHADDLENYVTPATPPAIPSDVSAALLKYSFAFVSHFTLKMVVVFQQKRSYKKIFSQ